MIVIRMWGGLGNQMFQYAFAKSFQKKTGIKVYLDCEKSYNDSLPGTKTFVDRQYELDNFRTKIDKISVVDYKRWEFMSRSNLLYKFIYFMSIKKIYPIRCIIDNKNIFSVNKNLFTLKSNCYIMGWFQNEMYFKGMRKDIIRDFAPKNKIIISKALRQLINNNDVVSIHIRRGDYVKHNLCIDLDYYYRAVKYICGKIEEPIFLIFSDDVNWVRKNINITNQLYFIDDFKKYEDYEQLHIMSRCKHNIIANSSFSWWGAWLNQNPDKIVIAPNKWWLNSVESLNIIPCEWIRI